MLTYEPTKMPNKRRAMGAGGALTTTNSLYVEKEMLYNQVLPRQALDLHYIFLILSFGCGGPTNHNLRYYSHL